MITINDKEFMTLVEYLRKNYGINLIKKRTLVESRLNNYLVANGFDNYTDFLAHAFSDETGEEFVQILNRLTTNYSYFMREWDHFRYFKERVLSELAEKVKDFDLRIWSAGCSTGQEPYTLAMLIADFFGEKKGRWDTKILATDISMKALAAAKKGVYTAESLQNVPPRWKSTYFQKLPDGRFEVSESLKKEVIFRRFNLIEDKFPFRKKFHVIFCRNVMIYFADETKKTLVKKFHDFLEPGGYLFIGQSETIQKDDTMWKNVMPSIYKKVG